VRWTSSVSKPTACLARRTLPGRLVWAVGSCTGLSEGGSCCRRRHPQEQRWPEPGGWGRLVLLGPLAELLSTGAVSVETGDAPQVGPHSDTHGCCAGSPAPGIELAQQHPDAGWRRGQPRSSCAGSQDRAYELLLESWQLTVMAVAVAVHVWSHCSHVFQQIPWGRQLSILPELGQTWPAGSADGSPPSG